MDETETPAETVPPTVVAKPGPHPHEAADAGYLGGSNPVPPPPAELDDGAEPDSDDGDDAGWV